LSIYKLSKILKNYIPRTNKVTKPKNNKIIKLIILAFLLILILTLIFFSNSKNNSLTLDDQVFKGEYQNNKKFIKIDKLKFRGFNNQGNPYLLTAKEAIKETENIDVVKLFNVQADIFLSEKDWFFLNTKEAIFKIKDKTLFTDNNVKGFYDDGSSFSTPSIEYDFNSGIAKSEEGIVMFGKWGNIKADKFSFNSFKDVYSFSGKAVMIVK
tara:strand:+ start:267 stop:899 length:633 start_codon:yes stop_codon:yes gene_type:complete